jgi:uroporphyrinogen-III decarboxylase
MCYSAPELLDALLTHLADQMAAYICYQIESGAQCMQVCVVCVRERVWILPFALY